MIASVPGIVMPVPWSSHWAAASAVPAMVRTCALANESVRSRPGLAARSTSAPVAAPVTIRGTFTSSMPGGSGSWVHSAANSVPALAGGTHWSISHPGGAK